MPGERVDCKLTAVLFINYYDYPDGDAGSIRVRALIDALRTGGIESRVLGMGRLGPNTYAAGVTSLRRSGGTLRGRLVDRLMYSWRVGQYLHRHGSDYTHIVFSSIPLGAVLAIRRWARRHGRVLIHDSVEWYSSDQFAFGRLDPRYAAKDILNRLLIRPPIRVIAISSFLERHFSGYGCAVVRVPAIVVASDLSTQKSLDDGTTRITYAGSPGAKDDLGVVVEAFLSLNFEERKRATLTLIGVTPKGLVELYPGDGRSASLEEHGVRALGRVPHADVLKELQRTDYTVLVRDPSRRVARAGFPTKVVESLATGTPVICNDSSDLGSFLTDGREMVLVREFSVEAVADAFRIAIAAAPDERALMRIYARECAESKFSSRVYSQRLMALFGAIGDEYGQANRVNEGAGEC